MLTCSDAERLIARSADEEDMSSVVRRDLGSHLAGCASCREAFAEQQDVVRILRTRPAVSVDAGFAARVADRIDVARGAARGPQDEAGWLGLANWRAWTVGLVPVAAGLLLGVYLGVDPVGTPQPARETAVVEETQSIEDAASLSALGTTSVFFQPSASGDVLLEAVLTGTVEGAPK